MLKKKRACELNKSHIISTDEDPGLRIESFAVINLRGVSTNKTIICFIAMQTYKEFESNLQKNRQNYAQTELRRQN
jgi:hypothetical protein